MVPGRAYHAQRRRVEERVTTALCALAFTLATSCIVEDDEACDVNQVLVKTEQARYCECAPGAVPDTKGYGCVLCTDTEQVVAGKCECKSGYSRPPAGGACALTVGQAFGAACTGPGSCGEPYPYCATDGSEQYCTNQGCSASSPCPSGQRCSGTGASAYCEKVSGLTQDCTTDADCAAFDASGCDAVQTHKCVVTMCAPQPAKCPASTVCCDSSALMGGRTFSTCIGGSSCPVGTLVNP